MKRTHGNCTGNDYPQCPVSPSPSVPVLPTTKGRISLTKQRPSAIVRHDRAPVHWVKGLCRSAPCRFYARLGRPEWCAWEPYGFGKLCYTFANSITTQSAKAHFARHLRFTTWT